MSKIKIVTILGTRPEVIKLAPVIKKLENFKSKIISKVIFTGQHRKMANQFLDLFGVDPDYDLDIMLENQTLFDISSHCLLRLSYILKKENPDLILIEGDTTTAFISALCAFYLKIPTGHVEAGLRTYDKYRPYPEEVNRRLISAIADLHFAPTKKAKENLLCENVNPKKIYLTGNTIIDALYSIADRKHIFKNGQLRKVNFKDKKVVLVTAHRRESFGSPLKAICQAIRKISEFPDIEIIYPVHLNPNVQKPVDKILKNKKNIHLLKPLDYESFIHVLKQCYLVLTDSGGVQEEAPAFGKPILVMREVTERPEGVEAGIAHLTGMNLDRIVKEVKRLLFSKIAYKNMAKVINPYGDGRASGRIVNAILKKFGGHYAS